MNHLDVGLDKGRSKTNLAVARADGQLLLEARIEHFDQLDPQARLAPAAGVGGRLDLLVEDGDAHAARGRVEVVVDVAEGQTTARIFCCDGDFFGLGIHPAQIEVALEIALPTIEKILVKSGQAVEFGQPLFLVRPG